MRNLTKIAKIINVQLTHEVFNSFIFWSINTGSAG